MNNSVIINSKNAIRSFSTATNMITNSILFNNEYDIYNNQPSFVFAENSLIISALEGLPIKSQ